VRNGKEPGCFDLLRSKEPRPQGGALKPYSKTKNEIPEQVRDDKKERNQVYTSCSNLGLMQIRLVSASGFCVAERARNAAPYAIDFSRSSAMS
jgi:hypothetical protein